MCIYGRLEPDNASYEPSCHPVELNKLYSATRAAKVIISNGAVYLGRGRSTLSPVKAGFSRECEMT